MLHQSSPLLACMLTLSLYLATHPIVLAVTIHTLPWKGLKNAPFLFCMASSLVFFVLGHGVETSNLGDVSAQELCQASGDLSLEQVGIDVSAPCTHESNSLDVNTTKYARSSRKVQENKVTLCDVGSSCNAQQWKVTLLRSSNLSWEIHNYRPLSSCHALPADRRNKALEY